MAVLRVALLAGASLGCGEAVAPHPDTPDCPATVESHGGRPVERPVIVNAYWGRYWDTPLASANAFLPAGSIPRQVWDDAGTTLATSRELWALLDEYQVGHGAWGGSAIVADDDDQQPIAEERIQQVLERAIADRTLPDRPDAIYVLYLAPGQTAAGDYVSFGGGLRSAHHGFYRGAGDVRRVYAVIEAWSPTMGGHSIAASHEIVEAATDPDFSGYWDSSTGAEIADLCVGSDIAIGPDGSSTAGFFERVHRVWSPSSCGCGG